MDGRTAIITGAGNGLGAAFAERIARDRTQVLVNNRRHADRPFSPDAVLARIEDAGGSGATDDNAVDDPAAADRIVQAALDRWGRLDALVLNAGISGPAIKVGDGDTEIEQVFAINLFANVRLVEAALEHLKASPAGRIVFVSSTGGLHGVRGRSAYAASKGALNGYALSLADELRRTTVRVNVIAPYAATKMTAQPGREADPRMGPDGAADACAWLAGPDCDRTGEIWVAGGGHVRAARAMESRAAPFAPATLAELSALPDARGFTGGEAAFADFYTDALGDRT